MKYLILIALIFPRAGFADPGNGIVTDSKGNIFYTDLKQVWKQTADGKKEIAVSNVHTHELYVDKDDNLYGEHLWFNGEASNTWGHYVWKRSPNGTISYEKKPTVGFPEWYSFVRDTSNNMYYRENNIPINFWRIHPDGKKDLLASKNLSAVGRMYFSSKGNLYFNNGSDVYRYKDSLQMIYTSLASGTKDNHAILSIWTDSTETLYVIADNCVKKIISQNKIETLFTSNGKYGVCGGVFDKNGDLWLLESTNAIGDARIFKLPLKNENTIAVTSSSQPTKKINLLIGVAFALVIVLLLAAKKLRKRVA